MPSKQIPLIAIVVLCLGFVACGPAAPAPVPEPHTEDRDFEAPLAAEREVAMKAKSIALQYPGVEAAFAVLASPATLLVGVRLEDDAPAEQILDGIAARIRDEVTGLERVLISSDHEVVREIRDIQEALGDGHPIDRYAEALDDLTSRMVPGTGRVAGQDSP